MAALNSVQLIGNLGADPEIRYTQSGKAVANFNMATNEQWGKGEDKAKRTEWHRIVAWDRLGEIVGEYCKKGKQVFVQGRLQTRSWEDKDGVTRYTTEIVAQSIQLLGAPNGNGARPPVPPIEDGGPGSAFSSEEPTGIPDNDIPF